MAGCNTPSSLCHCPDRQAVHVHCFCGVCKGKAVNYRTQISHLKSSAFWDIERTEEQLAENELEANTDRDIIEADGLCTYGPIEDEHGTFEVEVSSPENDSNASGNFYEKEPSGPAHAEEETALDDMAEPIVKCIFESLDIIQETGASLNTFQDLLVFARHMFCRGRGLADEDQTIKAVWPGDWETARQYLVKLGYQDAREYFICLDDSHKHHWDIMDNKTDTCRHCGQPGKLKYYYLGLKGKVKQWVSSPQMCHKMTGHWREKEHWLGRERGWHIKREVWDGDRFCEVSQ